MNENGRTEENGPIDFYAHRLLESIKQAEIDKRAAFISAPTTRSYVVGLPVVIYVGNDGTVVYEVDTSEASSAMKEEWVMHGQETAIPDQLTADMMRVDMHHDANHVNQHPTV